MYQVSNIYKTAMKKNSVTTRIRGTINTTNFTSSNILAGSLSINNKISDGTEIRLGTVTTAELRATFIDLDFDDWEGAVITLEEGLRVDTFTYLYVPIGVYTIKEANQRQSGVEVVAYDNMTLLDKKYAVTNTNGHAWAFLQYIATRTGITIGMTQEYVEALPNGNKNLALWAENDIETYRDLVYWLAQTLACYTMIDRTGALVFKPYSLTTVDAIDVDHRLTGGRFSKFVTRYSSVSVVDMKTKTTKYYGADEDIYLTYNLGSNPFLQYGTKAVKEEMCRNILTSLENVQYTPFEVTLPCGAAYDLGDVIRFEDGIAGEASLGCITSYSYVFGKVQNMKIKGEGKNPDLANAKSKTEKNVSGLLSQVSGDQMQFYMFSNTEDITIPDTKTREITYIIFASLKETMVTYHAEILLESAATVSGNQTIGVVKYKLNNVDISYYQPTETWIDGKHILHLLYVIPVSEANLYKFVANLTASGGDIEIKAGGIQAVITGQGLALSNAWDGFIDIEESIPRFRFTSMRLRGFSSSVSVAKQTPYRPTATANITGLKFTSMRLRGFDDSLFVNKDSMSAHTHAELSAYTHEDLHNSFIHG